MRAPHRRTTLPDYLGFGWLDRDSVRLEDEAMEADYASGEELIYRVRSTDLRAWSITEYLDLKPMRTATGSSLSEAAATLAVADGRAGPPVVAERLRRRLRDRVDMTDGEVPLAVDMWALYVFEVLAVYAGTARPAAPDFRPKSWQVARGRQPTVSGDPIHFWSAGVVHDSAGETPCAFVSYRTPAINVVPMVEALLDNPTYPAPWRIVLHLGHPGAQALQCDGPRGSYRLERTAR